MSQKDEPKEKRYCTVCKVTRIDSICESHPKSHSLCYHCHLKKEHKIEWDNWKASSGYSLSSGPDLGPTPRERKLEIEV